MKKILLFAALLFLPAPLFASINEDDYLKKMAAQFDAADVNKNGMLDEGEKISGSADDSLLVSPATRAACEKSRAEMTAYSEAQAAKMGKPLAMPRSDYTMVARSGFERMDTNHDHILSDAELAANDKASAEACAKIPEMLAQLRSLHAIKDNAKLSPQQKQQGLQGVDRNLEKLFPSPPPAH